METQARKKRKTDGLGKENCRAGDMRETDCRAAECSEWDLKHGVLWTAWSHKHMKYIEIDWYECFVCSC